MTAIESINKLIRDTVDLLLESQGYTIKARQLDAPRPTGDYGDVDYVTGIDLGWEQRKFTNNTLDDDMTETIQGMREIIMSVNFYRTDAIDNARAVRTGLVRESIQSLFSAANVGLIRRSEVREISEPLENGWEERAQLDIVLNVVGEDSDIVKAIASVDISAEFQFRDIPYNSNIEV